MNSLTESLEASLQKQNLTLADWQALIQRLLDYGVLCRDESQVETELYDRFVRIEALVDEYLSLMGARLQHDERFCFVRIIPPGARLPGLEDETDEPFNGGYRARLQQQDVVVLLALRAEYDKALAEGQLDENGCVTVSLERLVLALKNLLGRELPDNLGERRQLFRRLRQMRVVHYAADTEFDSIDAWLKIRPLIVNLINSEWLARLSESLPEDTAAETDEPPTEKDDSSLFSESQPS